MQPTDGLRSWCLFVQFVNSIMIESDWEYLDPMKVNLHVYDFFFFFNFFNLMVSHLETFISITPVLQAHRHKLQTKYVERLLMPKQQSYSTFSQPKDSMR